MSKLDLETIKDLYYNQLKSKKEIRLLYHCNNNTINQFFIDNNIIERTKEENKKIQKEKREKTNLKKYGTIYSLQNKEVRDKIKQTMIKKYGVDHNFKLRNEIKQIFLTKYGVDNPMKIKNIQEKAKKTMKEKYGVNNPSQSEIIKNKKEQTLFKNYGVINPSQSEIIKNKINQTIQENATHFSFYTSTQEKEIKEFLIKELQLKTEIDFFCRDRSIIGEELDFYFPNFNLAIEVNGLYWHNELKKDMNYHLNKTILCEQKNIRLIHIFEDDWQYKKDICKSIIASGCHIYQQRILARKCKINIVDLKTYETFLEKNHIQGKNYAQTCLGLFYNNELVQVCGFTSTGLRNKEHELVRMATKLNTQVVCGFSRLVMNYHKITKCDCLHSYIMRSLFDGKGYKQLGFKIVNYNKPEYYYIVDKKRIPRWNFMRKKIEQKYYQGILKYWNPEESEHINMLKNQIYRIYGCGTIHVKLIFNK